MNISEDTILKIKTSANIVDIISESIALKKAGKDFLGLCPFHRERTPSFSVSAEKQMYFCFGCGTAGDVFEFLMKKNGMSFLEAAKQLAARYGIDLPEISASVSHRGTPRPPGRTRGQRSEVRGQKETEVRGQPSSQSFAAPGKSESTAPPELWQEKAGKLVAWAHEKLLKFTPMIAWLVESRGIKLETIKHFHLGWNPGKDGKDLFRPRESWGLPTEMKDDRKKKLWLPIGLVIPMFACRDGRKHGGSLGHVYRLRIRRPGGSKPTYYIIPGSSMATWVMQKSPRVYVIIESELDGILLWQEARDVTGIISLGSSSTRPDLAAIKLLQKSSWILNALDFDQAGASALEWWTNHFSQHHRWPVPAGKDPGEAFQAGINLKEWIISGFPPGWIGQFLPGSKKRTKKFTGIEVKYGDVVTGKNKNGVDVFQGRARQGGSPEVQPQAQSESLPIDSQPALSGSLQKLEKLLKQYPVTISSTKERVYLREAMSWVKKNPEVSNEISNLVFMTPEIFEYICNHPARIITGDNLISHAPAATGASTAGRRKGAKGKK